MTVDERLDEAKKHAKDAGLRYVYDSDPGYSRRKSGKGFRFLDCDGKAIKDKQVIERINALAIPPAYKDVWICRHANGHIQATGYDARGRKQYRYHAGWRVARDENKFGNMYLFAGALPAIRRKVTAALGLDGLPQEKVIAAVVRLLDKTGLRVGNDIYKEENETFGLTTISKKHIDMHGKEIELDFPGKGGKVWQGAITDAKVAKVISLCEDVPGYRLFKWLDENGTAHNVSSSDINAWLQDVSGLSVTAKDFRTWSACILFLEEAMEQTRCAEGKTLELKPVLKAVSARLGNTPAILQKSYVHPELIDLYRTGCFLNKEWQDHGGTAQIPAGFKKTEALLLRWLQKKYE